MFCLLCFYKWAYKCYLDITSGLFNILQCLPHILLFFYNFTCINIFDRKNVVLGSSQASFAPVFLNVYLIPIKNNDVINLKAQSFTYLMADLCQEKNRMSAFIKVGTSMEHFLEGIALSLHTKAFLQGIFQLIK